MTDREWIEERIPRLLERCPGESWEDMEELLAEGYNLWVFRSEGQPVGFGVMGEEILDGEPYLFIAALYAETGNLEGMVEVIREMARPFGFRVSIKAARRGWKRMLRRWGEVREFTPEHLCVLGS